MQPNNLAGWYCDSVSSETWNFILQPSKSVKKSIKLWATTHWQILLKLGLTFYLILFNQFHLCVCCFFHVLRTNILSVKLASMRENSVPFFHLLRCSTTQHLSVDNPDFCCIPFSFLSSFFRVFIRLLVSLPLRVNCRTSCLVWSNQLRFLLAKICE